MDHPLKTHWQAVKVKRFMPYLAGTQNLGMHFFLPQHNNLSPCMGFVMLTELLTLMIVVLPQKQLCSLVPKIISSWSRKQSLVARSSAEI
jgi:hypothetical protein